MALSGTWKRTSTEGAEGFLKLFTQDEGKLARAAKTDLVSEITDSGNTVVIKRTWTEGGESRTNSNTINIGAESELTGPLGTTYKAVVNRSGDKLTTTANGADVVIEIVGGQLVETMSAKGQTFKRISSK